ncbi:MAG: hypothetical protein GQ542_14655 [Desulforhopalus sp.]|nr:hypothetical protein [Desulforhopalus sp.]
MAADNHHLETLAVGKVGNGLPWLSCFKGKFTAETHILQQSLVLFQQLSAGFSGDSESDSRNFDTIV